MKKNEQSFVSHQRRTAFMTFTVFCVNVRSRHSVVLSNVSIYSIQSLLSDSSCTHIPTPESTSGIALRSICDCRNEENANNGKLFCVLCFLNTLTSRNDCKKLFLFGLKPCYYDSVDSNWPPCAIGH